MNKIKHIAIILDGNGRYAKKLNKDRTYGHEIGIKNIINISKFALKKNINYLTYFCFSTQNWKRSKIEIDNIFRLVIGEINNFKKSDFFCKTIIRFIGDFEFSNVNKLLYPHLNNLSELIKEFNNNIDIKNINKKLVLTFAINYGGQEEILDAINSIRLDKKIDPLKKITKDVFENHMWSAQIPNVDILIRTSGEKRISNFLIWKLAYSELFFIKKMWPEFTENDFDDVIHEFITKRTRRFGGY